MLVWDFLEICVTVCVLQVIENKWDTYLDLLQADYDEGSAPNSSFSVNIAASLNFYYYIVLLFKLYKVALIFLFFSPYFIFIYPFECSCRIYVSVVFCSFKFVVFE